MPSRRVSRVADLHSTEEETPDLLRQEALHQAVAGREVGQHGTVQREGGEKDDRRPASTPELVDAQGGQVEHGPLRGRPGGLRPVQPRQGGAEEVFIGEERRRADAQRRVERPKPRVLQGARNDPPASSGCRSAGGPSRCRRLAGSRGAQWGHTALVGPMRGASPSSVASISPASSRNARGFSMVIR